MALFRCLLTISTASVAVATIAWGPCDDVSGSVQCATLNVPLDYTAPLNNRTLTLQLAKVPAAKQPSRGSILLNFGGPGLTSRDSLAALSPTLVGITGGQHDLVTFDPRGTGNTLPFKCFDDFGLLQLGIDQGTSNASDAALGSIWARATLDAQTCLKNEGDIGSHIGTAFVARDMISIVDALDEDGMLRYWGFSYGTTLGATVAAMFPERVDKLILDAVQNPHEYYHDVADFEEWTDSDKVISGIFRTCLDFPENCALAGQDATAENLEQQFWDFLWKLKAEPVVVGQFKLDYNLLKLVVASNLYDSATWPYLALLLQGLFQGQSSESMEQVISMFYPMTYEGALSETLLIPALEGIHCSDRIPRLDSLEKFKPVVERLYSISRFMGDVEAGLAAACAQWGFEAKERYEGNFNVETANPILVIGNHFDGHTPLVSAYNVSSGFHGSRVLEVAGYGHSSLAVPSECTVRQVSAYFLEGTLPEHGYVCNATATPYSGLGWDNVLKQTASANRRDSTGYTIGDYRVPKSYAPGRRWLL